MTTVFLSVPMKERFASIVLAGDHVLVTGNVRHFERVPELRVENWRQG